MSVPVVHCLQHSERVRPLGVAEWAAERAVDLRVVRVDLEPLPAATDIERLVVLGGGMNTDEATQHPWLDAERAFLEAVLAHDRARVLGICLGSQLLAEVLGGEVARASEPEIGWQRIRVTEAGRRSFAFSALPEEFHAFQWHGDAWTIPPGAELVATSDGCAMQAFTMGPRVTAVQFHPEFTLERTHELATSSTDDLSPRGWIQSPEQFLAHPARFDALAALCRTLLDRAMLAPLPVD